MTNELQIKQDASLFSESKFEHAFRIAKMISTTQLIPKAYQNKPADVLVAFEFGRSLGLGQLQSLQNISVINGKPCMWGDAVLAVCQAHADFEYIKEIPIKNGKGDVTGFECHVKRRSYPEETVRIFTMEDAKRAGLWGRNTWAAYPDRMMQMRARGFALRDTFADALSGISVAEEVQDYQIKDVTPRNRSTIIKEDVNRLNSLIDENKRFAKGAVTATKKPEAQGNAKTHNQTANINHSDAPEVDEVTGEVAPAGQQKADVVDAPAKAEPASLDQLKKIKELVEIKEFNNGRMEKALAHYKIDAIESVDSEQANDFISRLEQA